MAVQKVKIGAYSAYAIAVKNGYTGTEEEWLESLKGASAYELAVAAGYEGTEEEWVAAVEAARTSAEESMNAAKNSADAAESSANAAKNSADAAATSAENASTSESNAKSSADAAASSATAANTSASNAADSATAASASAESASTSAGTAADCAAAASTSASNASTSESNAATSAETASEAAKTTAENAEIVAEVQAAIAENVDYALVTGLDGTLEGYKATMRLWFRANGSDDATPEELTALCDRWFSITRPFWDGYTTFYQPDVSAVSTGTKGGDNANLSCTPSTDTVARQDDYAALPLFVCLDCNWTVDADTLEPVITAIEGITDNFVRNDPDVYVGVLQMSGYHYQYEDENTYTHGYTANYIAAYADISPVPEAVRVDGTVRQWVVHGKYPAMKRDDGGLTCCAGVIPSGFISHNTLHTATKVNGAQYSGGTTADDSWLFIMCLIKYGSLTLDGIIQGCCNLNYQYVAQVAEEGVSRIILSTANAANLEVGMSCILGNYAGNMDRGQSAMASISGTGGCRITAIETITLDDTEYSAVYVDVADPFDTAANGSAVEGTTYLSTWHWTAGSTDGVLGNDGSPVSCTSGKYPAKLQGIEFMPGAYEVLADVILSLYSETDDDGNTLYYYQPYIVKRSANQSTSITSSYEATELVAEQPASTSWRYIKRRSYAAGVFFPTDLDGSSSTYTRDAFYMNAATTGTREWLARGLLSGGTGSAGLSCLYGFNALSSGNWYFGARLSPTGNRGELAAA